MMKDARYLHAGTKYAAFSQAGAKVAAERRLRNFDLVDLALNRCG